jgi:hypothetical protein
VLVLGSGRQGPFVRAPRSTRHDIPSRQVDRGGTGGVLGDGGWGMGGDGGGGSQARVFWDNGQYPLITWSSSRFYFMSNESLELAAPHHTAVKT